MRNFRKIAVRVLAVFLTVCLFEGAVRLCFESWKEYSRVSKWERGDLKGTIDTVYIGTSLIYRAVDPAVLDGILGTNSFNLATSAQPMMGSYFLIRDAAEENPIRTVFLGISMASMKQKKANIRHVLAYDNLRTWKWKLAYLATLRKESVATTSLLYSTRVDSYTQFSKIRTNLTNKLSGAKPSRYGQRGFRPTSRTYKGGLKREKNSASGYWNGEKKEAQVVPENRKYLDKIAQYCQSEGIRLVLFVPPFTQDFIDRAGDLDDWNRYCREFSEKWGIEFYNFLLYKDRQTRFTDEMFREDKHMNKDGAELFSSLLAEISASGNPQEYFYTSMSEFQGAHP